ncbi:hypothetical protein AB0910_12630 [Streptomyces sp. NPDC047002]|uniref:hypothetical protein n=1 Tax=Streptomyces sp. NPDC047002 TaxID=3155475 RepID=UPI00345610E3
MGWSTDEFGRSHEGRPGALLADGTEPKPVYVDLGSSSNMHEISDWWVYDGRLNRPRASEVRGACSCGWRGAGRYAIDWGALEGGDADGEDPYDIDLPGPYADWERHLDEVRARSVPLPAGLQDLIDQVESRLDSLVDQAPLAALKAVADLERTVKRVAGDAAYAVEMDELSWETVGKALGVPEREARSRLLGYALRRNH